MAMVMKKASAKGQIMMILFLIVLFIILFVLVFLTWTIKITGQSTAGVVLYTRENLQWWEDYRRTLLESKPRNTKLEFDFVAVVNHEYHARLVHMLIIWLFLLRIIARDFCNIFFLAKIFRSVHMVDKVPEFFLPLLFFNYFYLLSNIL